MEIELFKQITEYGMVLTLPAVVIFFLYREWKSEREGRNSDNAKSEAIIKELQEKLLHTVSSQILSTEEMNKVLSSVVTTNQQLITLFNDKDDK